MDKDFNDLALVTDPPAVAADLRKPDPAIGSLERATDRFREFHGGILYEGSVFRLERQGAGPARLVGRRCNLAEHLHAISQPEERFSFASRLGLDYSGMFGAFDPRGYKRKITD